jgi:hypothetical protein
MKVWTRSKASFACGRCANILPPGSPRLQFVFRGKNGPFAKDRCEHCADEPVPADLPIRTMNFHEPLVLTAFDIDGVERPISNLKPMTPIQRIELPVDWRKKAAGE